MKAGCVDPVGSFGASAGPDHRETAVLAFPRRAYRCWRAVIPETEVGPMLSPGVFLAPSTGAPRRVTMHRHSPGRASVGVERGRKSCCDRRCQVLECRCWRWSWWSSSICLMGAHLKQPRMDGSGPRAGSASIAFPQRLRRPFSPAAKGRHSSRNKKAVCRRPPLALRA